MNLNVFILFSEDEDAIYESIKTQSIFDYSIKETSLLLKQIRQEGFKLYYDSENIKRYFDICCNWGGAEIDKGLNNLRYFLSIKSIDINTKPLKDTSSKYVLWNFDFSKDDIPLTIAEITERKYRYEEEECILIDLQQSMNSYRDVLLAFKDAKHEKEFPAPFIRIPHIVDLGEFQLWVKTNHIKSFSLFDKSCFQKTNQTCQGKPIFKEILTGHYWYLDNFHKDEYEVFDTNYTHIGATDLQGNIKQNSKVNGRRIEM